MIFFMTNLSKGLRKYVVAVVSARVGKVATSSIGIRDGTQASIAAAAVAEATPSSYPDHQIISRVTTGLGVVGIL
jgi:hypothetical protein